MVDKRVFYILGAVVVVLAAVALMVSVFGGNSGKSEVSLYYVDPIKYKLEKEIVIVKGDVDVDTALELLFKGTSQPGLESLFPEGVAVRDSYVNNDKDELVVDLTSNFLSINYGIEVNYLLVMSVVYTALDASGFDRVTLLFDGAKQEFFNEGVYLGGAFKKDPDVLK